MSSSAEIEELQAQEDQAAAAKKDEHHHKPSFLSRTLLQPIVHSSDSSVLWILYLTVFVDLLGASIVIPILPFYAREFGANSTQVGAIMTGYAASQFVSMLVMGPLSDRIGRRPSIIMCIFGSVAGFLAQGLAWNLVSFIAFRTAAGLFGGSPPIVQSIIADLFPKNERPQYLSMVGAVTAGAFTFGPAIGAGLSEFSLRTPMFVGAGIAFFNLIFALVIIPETNPELLKRYRISAARNRGGGAGFASGAAVMPSPEYSDDGEEESDDEGTEKGKNRAKKPRRKQVQSEVELEKVSDKSKSKGSDTASVVVVEDDAKETRADRVDSLGDNVDDGVQQRKSRVSSSSSDGSTDETASTNGEAGALVPVTKASVPDEEKQDDTRPPQEEEKVQWNVVIMTCFTAFLNVLGFTAFQSMFSLYMDAVFQLGALELGFVFTGVSVIFMFVQSIVWNWLRKKIGMVRTAIIGTAFEAVGLATIPLPNHPAVLAPSLAALVIGFSLVQPMIPSILTQCAPDKEQGRVLSMGVSMGSAARMVGPLVMGIIFESNIDLPFWLGGGISAVNCLWLIWVYLFRVLPSQPRTAKKEEQRYEDLIQEYEQDELDEWGSPREVKELGQFLANLLATRHYRWVSYYPMLKEHLKLVFPPLRPGRRAEDTRAIQQGAREWHSHFRNTLV